MNAASFIVRFAAGFVKAPMDVEIGEVSIESLNVSSCCGSQCGGDGNGNGSGSGNGNGGGGDGSIVNPIPPIIELPEASDPPCGCLENVNPADPD
jgi:hypothetical protein